MKSDGLLINEERNVDGKIRKLFIRPLKKEILMEARKNAYELK
jgi:hypothetical protein